MDDDLSDISELSSPPASPIAPPGFYPSPPPSQDADHRPEDDALPPARKRRRVTLPKERKTHELDLSPDAPLSRGEQDWQIRLLVQTLQQHRKVVVIAGAGISTSAGSTCHASASYPLCPYANIFYA